LISARAIKAAIIDEMAKDMEDTIRLTKLTVVLTFSYKLAVNGRKEMLLDLLFLVQVSLLFYIIYNFLEKCHIPSNSKNLRIKLLIKS
jgi:hypothetical protein